MYSCDNIVSQYIFPSLFIFYYKIYFCILKLLFQEINKLFNIPSYFNKIMLIYGNIQ